MTGMDAKLNPHRCWFRYSLRTLLIVVTIASAGFGWIGVKYRSVLRRRAAIETIRAAGGRASYGHEESMFRTAPPGPAWLRWYLGDDFFAEMFGVALQGDAVTDAALASLADLPA